MKKVLISTIALVLCSLMLIPMMAMAETITDIVPDTDQWGISRTKFKELNGKNYVDIEIGENKSLSGDFKKIDGYLMGSYYEFATPQKNYNGLSRVVYLLDVANKVSDSNLTKCYNALVKDLKQYEDPIESTKTDSVWQFQDCTIEIAIGDYSIYNQSEYKTVAIIFSDPNLPEEVSGETTGGTAAGNKSKNMTVSATASCSNYNSVGNEWSKEFYINGSAVKSSSQITVAVGDKVTVKAVITEEDKSPDIGTNSETHTITQSDLDNGFSISFSVDVRENKGRYSGRVATWSVTFRFS